MAICATKCAPKSQMGCGPGTAAQASTQHPPHRTCPVAQPTSWCGRGRQDTETDALNPGSCGQCSPHSHGCSQEDERPLCGPRRRRLQLSADPARPAARRERSRAA